jgi:Mrp family chromosome partitioning ATPase
MTALDRAFIRAYAEGQAASASGGGAPPGAASTVAPEREASGRSVHGRTPSAAKIARPAEPSPQATTPVAVAPLSSFTPPKKVDDTPRAAYEVDEIELPKACTDLLTRAGRAWDRFADQLASRLARGEKCIAIAGCSAGQGATTVALAAARHLARRGLRSVVVDANFDSPALAQTCGITPHVGWSTVVAGQHAVGEALIHSVADDVTLVAWQGRGKPAARPTDSPRLAALFNTLMEQYDLVLVDATPLATPAAIAEFGTLAEAIGLDALYLVSDARTACDDQTRDTCDALARAGVSVAGIIANFTAAPVHREARQRLKLPALASRLLGPRG